MQQHSEAPARPLRVAAPAGTDTQRSLLTLGLALALGGVAVWQLRQEWAANVPLPWLLLLAAMFLGGSALRRLDRWLPGEPILPRLAAFSTRNRQLAGGGCIAASLALTGWIVARLRPDFRQWQGTLGPWLAALALMLLGAWLLGAVGRGSPRAAAALAAWPDTRRNRWLEAAAVALIFALAIFLRTYRIDSIPPGIYVDETNGALDALYINEGRSDSPFGLGWYGTPNGYLYYMGGVFKLFGATWAGLKFASLLPAILTIPAVYLVGRLLFGPGAALAAMLIMAVSRWHLSMSRWGWNQTAPLLFQALATFFLIRGLRDRRARDYALGGLLTGLSFYTYLSSRLAAATLALYLLYWLWSDPAGWRAALRRCWLGLAIFVAAVVVAAAPLAVTYLSDPGRFNGRVDEISIFRDVREQNSLTPLIQNVGDILKFFHQTGDLQGKHNLPGEPMADPVTGLLFAIGLAYAILAWRDQRRVLLLLWLVLGLAGGFLSSHHESPQSYRTMTALPAVALLAGDTLDRVARALYRRLAERPRTGQAARWPAFAAAGLAIVALAGAALWESSVYFGKQARSGAVLSGFNPTENAVARETIAALDAGKAVYLSPSFSEFSPLRFLVYGVIKARTGENTLDRRPYHAVVPEVDLPLPDTGQDVLMLLDRDYWALRDYLAAIYPSARLELVNLPDGQPIYMRMQVAQADIAALQGLTERVTSADGRAEERGVAQVAAGDLPPGAQVEWYGSMHLDHGGEYELRGEGGLQVFVDGQPWSGRRYLGRGLYGLRVVRPTAASGEPRLLLGGPEGAPEPIAPRLLFRFAQQHGLLGTYYRGLNWEGDPLFRQVTPFLMLAWPGERPVAPDGEFSARYTGALRVAEGGHYRLRVEADDGARLTLDGQVLGEGLVAGQPNSFDAEVDLAPGDHPIQVDYFQQGGGTALRLLWSRDGGPEAPVPPAALVPAQP